MEQQRVRVDGWSDSDIHLKVAVIQTRSGQIHMAIEGVEPSIQNLVNIRQLLDQVCKKIDEQLPQMVTQSVVEMNK